MSDSSSASTPLSAARPFGLTSATLLVVANMIGAGVFTTSGFALKDLHHRWHVMAGWLLGGLIALCGALSYGGLVRRITESGGEYLFLSRVVHPFAGFLAGWVSLLAGFTGAIAVAALGLEAYLVPPGSLPWYLPDGSVAAAIIIIFGAQHYFVVRPGLIVQNAIVALKGVLLAGFVVYAFIKLPGGGWPGRSVAETPTAFSLTAFASSLVWISLGYSGFNAAVYVAGEVRDAERTVPRAMWIATLVVLVFYLLLNSIFLFAPLPSAIAGKPDVAAIAAEALGGPRAANFVRAVICLALLSSVSSMTIAGPRVYARMARDGVMPALFQFDQGSPRAAILLQVAIAAAMVFVAGLSSMLSYLGLTLSVSAAGTVAALFVLRKREGATAVPAVGYPFVPATFVIATISLAVLSAFHQPLQFLAATLTALFGAIAYRVHRRMSFAASSVE